MTLAAYLTLPTLCQQRMDDLLSTGTRQILAIVAQPCPSVADGFRKSVSWACVSEFAAMGGAAKSRRRP